MKKFLLFLILIPLIGCDDPLIGKKKSKAAKFSKSSIIEFRENTILLADGYSKTSPDEFKKRLDSLDKPKFRNIALEELQKIEDKKVEFQIFVDDKNVENYVFIYECIYYQLDEQRAAIVVDVLSKELKDESSKQEVRFKRIHGRFFFTPTSKIVKLKYLKAHKKNKKYETEYIVAHKTGGIGLLVSNIKNVDFEKSIKRLLAAN
ncbi:hypothetical protein AB832_05355 [Flavobacteriaceae bacterium (ex Bugula neritina AB1)]|nr:hypothetical protein AB832_05355 [Flavobacteriaceae bacterium (ex Bugula neritina AB1)]